MLSSDAQYATQTVLHEKPQIVEKQLNYDQDFLTDMIDNLGNINSLYHKTQIQMFPKVKKLTTNAKPAIVDTQNKNKSGNTTKAATAVVSPNKVAPADNNLLDDPFDMGSPAD